MSEENTGEVPGSVGGMYFESYLLQPLETLSTKDLAAILAAMDIRFAPEVFQRLPEEVRKHFVVLNRDGSKLRYSRNPQRRF